MEIKKCPLCGGDPKWVYHSASMEENPDAWEETEDGFKPRILFKHVECVKCRAMGGFSLHLKQAAELWNYEMPLQYIGEEPAKST